jgi:hypothetical protein
MDEVEILIKGHIDDHWSDWLGGLQITAIDEGRSRLSGFIADQAMLYGILAKLRDLDLRIISVLIKEGINNE